MKITRELFLPPPGRPNLKLGERTDFDLLYLSWGRREYGPSPVPVSMHDGWTYMGLIEGAPTLLLGDRPVGLRPGDAFILGPNCPYGLRDRGRASCHIMSWIWKHPPAISGMDPAMAKRISLSPSLMTRLQDIHSRCRDEAQAPDLFSSRSLDALRAELDIFLARAAAARSPSDHDTAALRLHLAIEWLHKQIATPDPVRALCDYLQVSPSTLARLFHKHLGSSPKTYIHRLRMEYASSLRPHYQLKEIAFRLGYRHPNDLSRALSRFSSTLPLRK